MRVVNKIKKIKKAVTEKIEYAEYSIIKSKVRRTFEKIFTNISKDLSIPIEKLSIGIEFRNSTTIYFIYVAGKKYTERIGSENIPKVISLDDYASNGLVNFDMTGGTAAMDILIGTRGVELATSIDAKVEDITVILKPVLTIHEGKTIFAYDLPEEWKEYYVACKSLCVTKDKLPLHWREYLNGKPLPDNIDPNELESINGFPAAMLRKRIDDEKEFGDEHTTHVRWISIEKEFFT